jgi:hypothetical protein
LIAIAAKKYAGKLCGGRARGALPAIGGNTTDGHAKSGTSLCRQKLGLLFIVWFATCSAGGGLWKERMTEGIE